MAEGPREAAQGPLWTGRGDGHQQHKERSGGRLESRVATRASGALEKSSLCPRAPVLHAAASPCPEADVPSWAGCWGLLCSRTSGWRARGSAPRPQDGGPLGGHSFAAIQDLPARVSLTAHFGDIALLQEAINRKLVLSAWLSLTYFCLRTAGVSVGYLLWTLGFINTEPGSRDSLFPPISLFEDMTMWPVSLAGGQH